MKTGRTSLERKLSIYGFELAAGGHNIYALLEFDITDLRSRLRALRREGRGGSLFALLLKAIGRCLGEFPEFNLMIDARRTTSFGTVDVSVPIEVEKDGKPVNKQHVIRDINGKSLAEVDAEILAAKRSGLDEGSFALPKAAIRLIGVLPRWMVLLALRTVLRNHRLVKELSGTIFVTSVSMFSGAPGYIIPYIGGPKAVSFAIGSAARKPVVRGDEIRIREMINITAVFNHDAIDGAPAARFINRLKELVEVSNEELF